VFRFWVEGFGVRVHGSWFRVKGVRMLRVVKGVKGGQTLGRMRRAATMKMCAERSASSCFVRCG